MIIRTIILKITLWLAYIVLPIAWFTTTTAGLNTGLTIATMLSPIQFSYGSVSGKIIGQPITIHELTVNYQGKILKVGQLSLDWQLQAMTAAHVQGLDQFLPGAKALKYQAVVLDHFYAHAYVKEQKIILNIQADGQSMGAPLLCNIRLLKIAKVWDIKYAQMRIGDNNINLQQFKHDNYKWNVTIRQPQAIFSNSTGTINAHGSIHNLQTKPAIHANIHSKNFTLNNYQINNLQAVFDLILQPSAPLTASITANKVIIDQHQIDNLKITLVGNTDRHIITSSASYDKEPLSFNTTASLKHKLWTASNINVGYKQENLLGNAYYDFALFIGKANLHGKLFTIPTQAQIASKDLHNLTLQLKMYVSPQNNASANINLVNNVLAGNVQVIAEDIAFLMHWMPDITRLKGKFIACMNIAGTIDQPDLTSEAHLTDITATIPRIGIKIKPMELHLVGNKHGRFMLNGKGKMRRGSGDFTLSGSIEPFKPDLPNTLNIVGTNVEFINNQLAHLTASSDLTLHYAKEQKRLDIIGDIEVQKGRVTIDYKRTQTVKSKDVIFVNELIKHNDPKYLIIINPDINLRITEGVHFSGFDLDADVTGKLNISHRHDALYADGRVTIKEGTFQLPGQKLLINHGRLLYPPGTLLANPVLDIKMLGKNPGQVTENNAKPDLELTVQGTAQKPVISESGLSGNKDRAISQALLTGTGVLSNNLLQNKLKISEIGLASRQTSDIEFFDDPSKDKTSLKNKDLVLGRSLGRKFYVQYLHSMGEANQRLRLKYSLNHIWALGLESGTQGGGADLSFTIER